MSTQSAQLERYGSGETLAGIPTRNDIISEYDIGLTTILQQSLSSKQPIHFMPDDVSDATEYRNGASTYILRIYGTLNDGQKARVNITGIKPFFDIATPDNEPVSAFKSRLVKLYQGRKKLTDRSLGLRLSMHIQFVVIISKKRHTFASLHGIIMIGHEF